MLVPQASPKGIQLLYDMAPCRLPVFMNINFGTSICAVPVGSSHCLWNHLLLGGSERSRKCLNTMIVEKRRNPSFQQYSPDVAGTASSLQWKGHWLEEPRFDFIFSKTSSPPLRPTQASFQWVTGFPPGGKATRRVADQSFRSCAEVTNKWSNNTKPTRISSWLGLG